MPGWKNSRRRTALPPNWAALRQQVLARDGRRCTWTTHDERCERNATDVDHIVPGDDHSLENLRALCAHHHRVKSSGEGGRASASKRAKRTREPERHPGMVTKRKRSSGK